MANRLRKLGIALAVIGLIFVFAGAYAYTQVRDGYGSLQAFSEAQNVTLSYNDQGQLIDRGTTEGADAIMSLLVDDWKYPVVASDLDPNDPLVNTATEYMFQMATIGYHVLEGTQTVVLAQDAEYKGETFPAGTYEFAVDGRYWTGFDRKHPIEGPARSQAWSGTVHGLFGELGVGVVTASTLQLALGVAALLAGIGLTALFTGAGLFWAAKAKIDDDVLVTVPEHWNPEPETSNI
ncbi:MAG: hypothetical protein BMS9Abin20_1075 [Acidimicrobiia bacterium]|nr:MAG: hypothetical protein BMS9Abin20_1075 [Acidimicrobiia bacterium]